jgi:aminotransferase
MSSKRVLKIGGGEPEYKTPQHIIDAMKKALDMELTHYGEQAGLPELREAVAKRYKRYGIDVNPRYVTLTPGSSMGIYMSAKALASPGDNFATMNPCFFGYLPPLAENGVLPNWIPRHEEEGWSIHADELDKAITHRTKAILLCCPDNPTGTVLTSSDLKAIAEVAIKHDLYVVSDDIYDDITYDGVKVEHIASLPGMKERTVILNGVSKAYAMTGWRLGYVVSPDEKIYKKMADIQQSTYFVTNPAIQYAAAAALTGPQDSVKRMVKEYDEKRRMVYDLYSDMRAVTVSKPVGAFYFFPNISSYGVPSRKFAEILSREESVQVTPGANFGSNGEYHFRNAYCQSTADLQEGLARIKKVLYGLKK